MKTVRMKLAAWVRNLDRALFFGWSIHSNATDETRYIAFRRVSLYVTDPISSWLERERCWLVRGREMEAEEELMLARRTKLRCRGYRVRSRISGEYPTCSAHAYAA